MAQTVATFDTGHEGQIHDTQLDYYGRSMATAGADGTIKIWNVSNPEQPTPKTELKSHFGAVWSVAFAHPKFPDLVASGGYDRQVIIWKLPSHIAYKDELARASVNCVKFSPFEAGLHLAAGSSDGNVAILSYGDNGVWTRSEFSAHPCGVMSVSWNPSTTGAGLEGCKLVTGGMDAGVKIWRYENGQWIREEVDQSQTCHKDWVTSVSWKPNSDIVASSSKDGTVVMWEFTGNIWRPKTMFQSQFGGQPVWGVEFAQVGGMLCVSYGQNQTAIFKEQTGQWSQIMEIDDGQIGGKRQNEQSPNLEAFGM